MLFFEKSLPKRQKKLWGKKKVTRNGARCNVMGSTEDKTAVINRRGSEHVKKKTVNN